MQNFSEEEDDEIHHVQLKSVDDELTKNKHHTYAISFQGSGWGDDETAIKRKREMESKNLFLHLFSLCTVGTTLLEHSRMAISSSIISVNG